MNRGLHAEVVSHLLIAGKNANHSFNHGIHLLFGYRYVDRQIRNVIEHGPHVRQIPKLCNSILGHFHRADLSSSLVTKDTLRLHEVSKE
jgi:hypothetical protein